MMKKRKLSFSQFQGSQTREGILNMLLQDPELFERIPGITEEQREAYERQRRRMLERGNSGGSGSHSVCGAVCDCIKRRRRHKFNEEVRRYIQKHKGDWDDADEGLH